MSGEVMRVPDKEKLTVGFPANTMSDLVKAGELLAQSGMFGISNPGAGFVVAATCHQQGITLMEFQRSYHIIEGKPAMRADAMLAALRQRGGTYKIIENSVNRAAIEIEFEKQKHTFAFSMEDAKRTGDCFKADGKTLKNTWEKRKDDMLWARCVSRAVRRICPEIVSGLYTPEEVSDFTDRPASREPVAIPPEEVESRVAASRPHDKEKPAIDVIDFNVCPKGFDEYSGKAWSEFDSDVLEGILESGAEGFEEEHYDAIRVALARKAGEK